MIELFLGPLGSGNIYQTLLSFVLLMIMFMFLPKLMLMQILYKIKSSVEVFKENADTSEETFLEGVNKVPTDELKESLEPMKSMVTSQPTSLDPAGVVKKLEMVLDTTEEKIGGYIDQVASDKSDEEKQNLKMGFKGVYGTYQMFVIMRHFEKLTEETQNLQIGNMLEMMMPLYKELSEAQMKATEAFVNEVPIGDSIGPMIAAKFMKNDEIDEVADDIVMGQNKYKDNNLFVMKSKGPGGRLGKYGNAVDNILEERDIDKVITVDAGMRYEGEETGNIVDGIGVMMGGPGVEKFKIEEKATEKDVPMIGVIVKQSGAQASKPMHNKIYKSSKEAQTRIKNIVENDDGENYLVIGVGNSIGVGNTEESTKDIPEKLTEYWKEQEEESTSYIGLMKMFSVGIQNQTNNQLDPQTTFEYFRSFLR